jgi:hypothetical protein
VQPIGDEPTVIPGQREPGRRNIGVRHEPVEADLAGQGFELQFSGSDKITKAQRNAP